jgi:hypothetical protein
MKRFLILPAVVWFLFDAAGLSASPQSVTDPGLKSARRTPFEPQDPKTKLFYENGKIVRSQKDKNGDGKPDFFCRYRNGFKSRAYADLNFDGKIDAWYYYNEKGALVREDRDTDKDGKPDAFYEYPEGSRQFVWKQYDRNGDGKIDRRLYKQWRPDRKTTLIIGSMPTSIPTPSYVTLIKEEDNDYDGIIDAYYEKGSKDTKVGQPIRALCVKDSPSPESRQAQNSGQVPEQPKKTADRERIERLNEKLAMTR